MLIVVGRIGQGASPAGRCPAMGPWRRSIGRRDDDETRRGLVVGSRRRFLFLAESELTARTGQNWRRLLISPRFGLVSMCTLSRFLVFWAEMCMQVGAKIIFPLDKKRQTESSFAVDEQSAVLDSVSVVFDVKFLFLLEEETFFCLRC